MTAAALFSVMPRMPAAALLIGGCTPLRAGDSVQNECDVACEIIMTKAAVDGFLPSRFAGIRHKAGYAGWRTSGIVLPAMPSMRFNTL